MARHTYHYAYVRQTQVNWKKKQRKEKKSKERQERRGSKERKREKNVILRNVSVHESNHDRFEATTLVVMLTACGGRDE